MTARDDAMASGAGIPGQDAPMPSDHKPITETELEKMDCEAGFTIGNMARLIAEVRKLREIIELSPDTVEHPNDGATSCRCSSCDFVRAKKAHGL